MKKEMLKAIAKLTENTINSANKTNCQGYTYQPKAQADIKNFKKK